MKTLLYEKNRNELLLKIDNKYIMNNKESQNDDRLQLYRFLSL